MILPSEIFLELDEERKILLRAYFRCPFIIMPILRRWIPARTDDKT
jgi:hypothetical protein